MISTRCCLLSLAISILLQACSSTSTVQDTSVDREVAAAEDVVYAALPPPPEWTLSRLDGTFILYDAPSQSCLQNYVNQISGGRAKKDLVEDVYHTAKAYGLDPVIFLGLIYVESGNFVADRTGGGTGVTQMTNVAIRDACHALETTDCHYKKRFANPEYEEIWKNKMNSALATIYETNRPEDYYPWELYCSSRPADRCNETCGINARCLGEIKTAMMKDNRVALNLGGLTLLNFMGVANKRLSKSALAERYRYALREYNGHPENKRAYPGKVFSRVEAFRKACPFNNRTR